MLQTLIVALLPGGQLRARRNAWEAMSECALRTRARADADAALAVAAQGYAVSGAHAAH